MSSITSEVIDDFYQERNKLFVDENTIVTDLVEYHKYVPSDSTVALSAVIATMKKLGFSEITISEQEFTDTITQKFSLSVEKDTDVLKLKLLEE